MSDPINISGLAVGTRVMLANGAAVEVVANPRDGMWLFARYIASTDNPAMIGQEELIFAQDVVEVQP